MKFKIYSSIFFTCFIIVANAQFIKKVLPLTNTDFTVIKIAGYKSCLKFKVEDNNSKILVAKATFSKNGTLKTVFENDDLGLLDLEDEKFSSTTEYSFKENGQLIYKEIKADESETVKVVYEYKNNVVSTVTTVSIDPTIAHYKYNAKGKLIEIYTTVLMPAYDEAGEFTGKSVDVPQSKKKVLLNSKGQIIQIDEYNLTHEGAEGTISYSYLWKYDTQNRVIEYAFKNISNDGIGFKETYVYNKQGLLIKCETTDTYDNTTKSFVFEYKK